jgi:hypothetical protein
MSRGSIVKMVPLRSGHLPRLALAAGAGLGVLLLPAAAEEACGTCAREVVTTGELASCFLERYDGLTRSGDGAVLVDLSDCPTSRGVVEALALPGSPAHDAAVAPTTRFMATPGQLECLKRSVEDPSIQLDPSALIPLDGCP